MAFVLSAFRLAIQYPDAVVVVAHIGVSPVAAALKLTRIASLDIMVLHGLEAWRRAGLVERLFARHSQAIVATTQYTANLFAELNQVRPDRFRVIPIGLPESNLDEPRSVSGPARRILTVSRLSRDDSYKGIDTLIRAVAAVRDKHCPEVTLDIIGDGDDRLRLEHLVNVLGLQSGVRFHTSVPDSELERFYSECTVFALPSAKEGFGIVFLEAMRRGKPCIGGEHGGTPEVIEDGADGFLVPHGDVSALTSRLAVLLCGSGTAARMGKLGFAKVRRKYLFEQMKAAWSDVMASVAPR